MRQDAQDVQNAVLGLTLVAVALTIIWTPWVLFGWGVALYLGSRFG